MSYHLLFLTRLLKNRADTGRTRRVDKRYEGMERVVKAAGILVCL